MSRRDSNDFDSIFFLIIFFGIITCAGIWKFGQVFNLDFDTSLRQIFSLIVYFAVLAGAVYLSNQVNTKYTTLKVLYPLAIFGFYIALGPAIGYWAAHDRSLGFYGDGMYWWYRWYSVFFLFICAIGLSWYNIEEY